MHTANRRVIYSRSFASTVVEVVEQAYADGHTYLVTRRGLFNDTVTVVGPLYSQAEALRFARSGAV